MNLKDISHDYMVLWENHEEGDGCGGIVIKSRTALRCYRNWEEREKYHSGLLYSLDGPHKGGGILSHYVEDLNSAV